MIIISLHFDVFYLVVLVSEQLNYVWPEKDIMVSAQLTPAGSTQVKPWVYIAGDFDFGYCQEARID